MIEKAVFATLYSPVNSKAVFGLAFSPSASSHPPPQPLNVFICRPYRATGFTPGGSFCFVKAMQYHYFTQKLSTLPPLDFLSLFPVPFSFLKVIFQSSLTGGRSKNDQQNPSGNVIGYVEFPIATSPSPTPATNTPESKAIVGVEQISLWRL